MAKTGTARRLIKRGVQHVAARLGPHVITHGKPQLLILMYHRTLPPGDPRARVEEPSMIVTPATFRRHLVLLGNHFEFVSLPDWLNRKASGQSLPARACAITFDDGWADNYEFAYPVLKEMAIPATIFLVSDLIGTTRQFWTERLARTLDALETTHRELWASPELEWIRSLLARHRSPESPPSSGEMPMIIDAAKSLPDQAVHDRLDQVDALFGHGPDQGHASLLDWEQVNDMLESGLVEVGSHTCTHTRLNETVRQEILEREIIDSKKHIETNTGHRVTTLCFPNGDYCQPALALARQHYNGAVTTIPGWNSVGTDNHMLRRINVYEDITADKTSFLARVSGWL